MKEKIPIVYRIARGALRIFFKAVYRYRVENIENLPTSGPYIICANHIHALDCVSVALAVKRHIHFMGKASLWKSFGIFSFLLDHIGAIPVNRDHNDLSALRIGGKVLKEGHILGIFPEGTRSRTGELAPGMPGTAYLAVRGQVPVVPCRIRGSYKPFKPVVITIGEPMELTACYTRRASSEALAEGTQQIMERIRDL